MTIKSFNRFFTGSVLLAVLGLQGCYEQSTKDSTSPIAGSDAREIDSNTGSNKVNGGKVEISLHPVSQTVFLNKSVTLNTSATAKGVIKYQWRKNGQPIADAVRSSFTISNAAQTDAGSYDVLITSGKTTATTQAANLAVSVDRSARLSWGAPSKRVDGSPLTPTEIAAYRIYHTSADGNIGRDYTVDSSLQSYALDGLPSGEHHFAVATVDLNGEESDLSVVVSKQIM
ncbi:immunoglobulin domain-containing protein [Allohahella marinimesophila]|uniref:Ig-like domain-containing protein n=1 Tax=Allohahella marinimesophila TaxID=1054972 RepID=A0ABP7Q013_9GAMM